MNEDIERILDTLKENYESIGGSYYPEDLFEPNDPKIIYDYIIQLQNNWNEINKFIEDNLKSLEEKLTNKTCDNAVAIYGREMNGFYKVRRKIRELEGNMSEEEWIEKYKDDFEHINDMVGNIELQQKYEPLVLEIISCDPNNFDEIFYKIVDLKIEEFKQLQQENEQLKNERTRLLVILEKAKNTGCINGKDAKYIMDLHNKLGN